jgi:hypothetical protein
MQPVVAHAYSPAQGNPIQSKKGPESGPGEIEECGYRANVKDCEKEGSRPVQALALG